MEERKPDAVTDIYEAHADFVWRNLARMGVRDADLPDATQEVFIVVSRKLPEREGTSSMTTWLYGICFKVAAAVRRRAHRKHEELVGEYPSDRGVEAARTPEDEVAGAQAKQILTRLLDALELEQRVVFVMFEMDGIGCQEIADTVGAPLGTVYTRLRLARQAMTEAAKRMNAVERRTSGAPA